MLNCVARLSINMNDNANTFQTGRQWYYYTILYSWANTESNKCLWRCDILQFNDVCVYLYVWCSCIMSVCWCVCVCVHSDWSNTDVPFWRGLQRVRCCRGVVMSMFSSSHPTGNLPAHICVHDGSVFKDLQTKRAKELWLELFCLRFSFVIGHWSNVWQPDADRARFSGFSKYRCIDIMIMNKWFWGKCWLHRG